MAVLTSLAGLVAAEFALRAWAPLHPSPYQADDQLLFKLVPGARKEFTRNARNGGQRIRWQVNRDGFRGEELRPPQGQERIIVYGDSNVMAEFSELPATFGEQLERHLRPHDIEVINAGVVGYGPDQVSLRLASDIATLDPALVLLVVYAENDFGDMLRNRIYRLNAQDELELNRYRLSDAMRTRLTRAAFPRGLRRLQLWHYAGRAWARMRGDTGMPESLDAYLSEYVEVSRKQGEKFYADYVSGGSEPVAEDPFLDYYDADLALLPDSASARLKVALMRKVLQRLHDTAARTSTPLALVILPSAIDVCDAYDTRVDGARYPAYDRARLSGEVEAAAQAAGIPRLNLFADWHPLNPCNFYFHAGDDHWNDAGQANAAQLTGEFIAHEGLIH